MATLTTPPPAPAPAGQASTKEEQPYVEQGRKRHTGYWVLGVIVVWLVLYAVFKGQNTRALSIYDTNGFHTWINARRDWLQLHGPDNWFFGGVLGHIGSFFNSDLQLSCSAWSARPRSHASLPQIGWLGVVALLAWVAWAIAGIRSMVLLIAVPADVRDLGVLAGRHRPAAGHLHRGGGVLRDRTARSASRWRGATASPRRSPPCST